MTIGIASITFDSLDPVALAGWWAERFGAAITANVDGFFVLVAGGSLPTQLAFQKVDDPTPGKNKLHLDIHTDDDLDAEVARWTARRGDEPREAQRRRLRLGHADRSGRQRVLHRRGVTSAGRPTGGPAVRGLA